jgi:hypothetical protein
MPTEIEELRAALAAKDDELQQLRAELEFAEDMFAKLRARAERQDDSGLPVPRLELRWIGEPESNEGEWEYNLVVKHFMGHSVFYPLGNTEVTGGSEPYLPNGAIRLPFRDGAHISNDMAELRLPGFVIRGTRADKLGDA